MNKTRKTKTYISKQTMEESVSTQEDYSSLIQIKRNDQINAEQNTHIINEMHIIATIY